MVCWESAALGVPEKRVSLLPFFNNVTAGAYIQIQIQTIASLLLADGVAALVILVALRKKWATQV